MNIDIKLTSRSHNDGIQVIANLSYERGGRVWHASVNGTGKNQGVAVGNLVKGARLNTLLKQALLKELSQKKMIDQAEPQRQPAASSTPAVDQKPKQEVPKPQENIPPQTSMSTPESETTPKETEASPIPSGILDGIPPESKSIPPDEEDEF